MPAGSFFPLGFDAPSARISLIYYSFHLSHFLIPFVMYFFFLSLFLSFLSLSFLFPPDLCFEEEC